MEDLRIGEIITTEQKRDAIHIAIFPAIAGMELKAGQHVGILEGSTLFGKTKKTVGIVDPYLETPVQEGERFWLFIYPNTVTSLKHNWTHPAFEDEVAKSENKEDIFHLIKSFESRKWLENFAEEHGISYDKLVEGANEYLETGEFSVHLGTDTPYDHLKDFWKHFSKVHRVAVPKDFEDNFFTCSC